MPGYELALIAKSALQRPEIAATLKRSCEAVWRSNGVVRNIENLGVRRLPYTMTSSDKSKWTDGHYFIVNLEMSVKNLDQLRLDLKRDYDVLRANMVRKGVEFERPCDKGPCVFGERPNPDHERRAWKTKAFKSMMKK